MFTTLDLKTGNTSSPRDDAQAASSAAAPGTGNGIHGSAAPRPTATSAPKRSQVRRACDWCKLMRIKCDSNRPCYNCQQGGRKCSMGRQNQFRSLAAAVQEIETLRAQLREFETIKEQQLVAGKPTEPPHSSLPRQPQHPSPRASLSLPGPFAVPERPAGSSDGVCVGPILYGTASLPFFLARMDHFLQTTRPHLDRLDMSTACAGGIYSPPQLIPDSLSANYLPPDQEIHTLNLFWQSHYFSFPIINEGQFRKEYQALVSETSPGAPRKPLPLVDIVLALCIQLASFIVRPPINEFRTDKDDGVNMNITGDSNSGGDINSNNGAGASAHGHSYPSLAGFQYYQRCQEAIDRTVESPTIVTVQCYIFSIIYLFEAGLLNRAQVVIGKAIMTAVILGLPNEPQSTELEPKKEIARRTWWSLYALDSKLSMESGRSPMIGSSFSTCRLPTDSHEMGQWLAPHYHHDRSCPPWLGFQTQTLHLLRVVGAVRSAFYAKYDDVVGESGYEAIVSNAVAREECARFLAERMKNVDVWAKQVPRGYCVPRKHGQPFSAERSTLHLAQNPNILIHCQRQRLLLELQYHQQCMSMYQIFICFSSTSDMSTPLADSNAAAGLNHAVALTSMAHQALAKSEALSGVYHVFRWQKNAIFTMLGYAYTFPLSNSRATICRSIDMAIAVVNSYRDALAEAGPVASLARVLARDLGEIYNGFYTSSSWSSSASTPSLDSSSTTVAQPPVPAPAIEKASNKAPPALDQGSFLENQGSAISTSAEALQAPASVSPDELHDFFELGMGNMHEAGDRQHPNWNMMDVLWSASLDPAEVSAINDWDLMSTDIAQGGSAT